MSPELTAETARLLGLPKKTSADQMITRIRKGLKPAAAERLAKTIGLPEGAMLSQLAIAPRTVQRHRQKKTALGQGDSDRLYRAAHVLARAGETLGDPERANHWMVSPNRALGGESPLSLLDTEVGESRVMELLIRIDHGLFS